MSLKNILNSQKLLQTWAPSTSVRFFSSFPTLLQRQRVVKPHKHDYDHPHYLHHHKSKTYRRKKPFIYRFLFAIGFTTIGYSIGKKIALSQSTTSSEKKHKFVENTEEYRHLHDHPMIKQLRQDDNFAESQYTEAIPAYHQDVMVTSGKLSGRGLLTVEPLVFSSKDGEKMYIFYHVGDQITHHHKTDSVHTGLLATLMDEGLSRCAFSKLPNKYGVTASLELDYRNPLPPDSYVVLKAEAVSSKGRKSWAEGHLEVLTKESTLDKHGDIIVYGKVLMIEPKWARYLVWLFK